MSSIFDHRNMKLIDYSTSIIPVSALKGDNILPDTKEPSWAANISSESYGGSTLVSDNCLTLLLG
jgi:translation elongation factor EF-1alpha